ncbi:hypothetical protein D3C86_1969550 [compost metagenome]
MVAVHGLAGALRDVLALLGDGAHALHHQEIYGRALNGKLHDRYQVRMHANQARQAALRKLELAHGFGLRMCLAVTAAT